MHMFFHKSSLTCFFRLYISHFIKRIDTTDMTKSINKLRINVESELLSIYKFHASKLQTYVPYH